MKNKQLLGIVFIVVVGAFLAGLLGCTNPAGHDSGTATTIASATTSTTLNSGSTTTVASGPTTTTIVAYTITYNSNGATGGTAPAPQGVAVGVAHPVIANNTGNLVKTGYQLVGWNTAADYSGYIQGLNAAYYNTPPGGSALTLYAEWMPADYSLSITSNGTTNTGLELTGFSDAPTGSFSIATGITILGDGSVPPFGPTTVTQISIPATVTKISGLGLLAGNLTSIVVSPSNPSYTVVSGALLTKDQTTLVAYPAAATGSVTVPATVTSIGPFGMVQTDLSSITIPASVTTIGRAAFQYSPNLTSITFLSDTPPTNDTTAGTPYDNLPVSFQIHVPNSAAVTAYQSAAGFSTYSSHIVTP